MLKLLNNLRQYPVLAYPWWMRVLCVLPCCLVLWLGVSWALTGNLE